jgi:hypothetical protein
MSFSDILSILEILVSVFVGFYLAHWYSVRDSQHRAVKEYYIKLISGLQKECEKIFHGVLNSSISGDELLIKLADLDSALEGFDEDLRRALPIKLKPIQEQIGDVTDKLTDLDDINEQLKKRKNFNLGNSDRITVRQLSKEAHRFFGIYINQININQGHHAWHELCSNFRNTRSFYKDYKVLRTFWSLFCVFFAKMLGFSILLILLFIGWKSYQSQSSKDEIEKTDLLKWRNDIIQEMKVHNGILKNIDDSISVKNEYVKNYYDCIFRRYETYDTTINK